MSNPSPTRLTVTQWLIIAIAAIGFLFDTYELLMTPLVGVPAIAELLKLPPNHPTVMDWMGRMLWITALCGGTFGLLGGWLIDRFGRKKILAASIFMYAFSPFAAAFASSLTAFIFFRCTTFIGVCVEFIAAITWLAELFPDKRRKEIVLGSTQAFASLGGVLVTAVSLWMTTHASSLPLLPISEAFNQHAPWRYLLITGLIPAIPIALMLPFVPESQVWRERRAAGTLKRPSFGALFSPELRRVTLVTAALSACAYAAAFGALQITTRSIVPGLPELAQERKELKPLRAEAAALNAQVSAIMPAFEQSLAAVPGLEELAGKRAKTRIAQRAARKADNKELLGSLGKQFAGYDAELDKLATPEAKKVVIDREKLLKALGDNREKQEPFTDNISKRGDVVQLSQETGGLTGRIILAGLLLTAIPRGRMLRLFLLPGVFLFAGTYFQLYHVGGAAFALGIFFCGLLVVAQFSYFGEYLPKVFPVHLRGTGGSFATNVGGRMIGTSAAILSTNIIAPMLNPNPTFDQYAMAAGITGTVVLAIAFALSFLLPEPKEEEIAQSSASSPSTADTTR
ncbi:MAG: nanT 3 [Chthoniobacteraceae bacterium]|nr:nanT 3 [Chthoniobacteraceae bacterium]